VNAALALSSAELISEEQIANPRARGIQTPSKFATCFGFPCVEIERNGEIGGRSDLREPVGQAGGIASNLSIAGKELLLGGFSGGVQHGGVPLRYTDRGKTSFFVALVVTASED